MFNLLSSGAGFGFTVGTIIGPLQTYLINETLLKGWQRSMIIAFTPLFADLPIIFLMVVVLKQLPEEAIAALQLIGGVFILTLVRPAWQQAQRPPEIETDQPTQSQSRTLGKAVMITWLSPGPYIFWGAVLGPLFVKGLEQSVWHGAVFLLGFYGTFVGIMLLTTFIFTRLRHLDKRIVQNIMRLSVLILIYFGLRLLYDGVTGL